MNPHMPLIRIKHLTRLLLGVLILHLAACSAPPKPRVTIEPSQPPMSEPQVAKPLNVAQLMLESQQAKQQQDWIKYIQLNTQVWRKVNARQQADIEHALWRELSTQSPKVLRQMANHNDLDVQAWSALINTMQGERPQQNLPALRQQFPNAIYFQNLYGHLNALLTPVKALQNMAVFLPLTGKFQPISEQIRSGISKAHQASGQTTQVQFYDSSNLNDLERLYRQAKQAGAQRIIGPLTKEAVTKMRSFNDSSIVALNHIGQAPFTQFNFKAANEAEQMIERLNQKGFKNIAILSSDRPADAKLAKEIQQAWLANDVSHHANLKLYANNEPKLNEALDSLIKQSASKERADTLRNTIGQSVEFFPRTRQDLDAIVLLDDVNRAASVLPMLAYYELKIPVYAGSNLSPSNFSNPRAHHDLKGVQFLTAPAVINRQNIDSAFEAFGWDAYLVANQLNKMQLGEQLNEGQSGWLRLDKNVVVQRLIWAVYNAAGQIEPADAP
jgi:hypothetical protein